MYVTRPLSMYRRSPQLLSSPPPEGPNSGYLVIHDEDCDVRTCCGCTDHNLRDLPFPQNKDLTLLAHKSKNQKVTFIPVLNQPLSSNRYHVIHRTGTHKGEVCTNSREDDLKIRCCRGSYVPDAKPKPLEPSDLYQQVEIVTKEKDKGRFIAKSVAHDGFPPGFLRKKKGWKVKMHEPRDYRLWDASGVNSSLRARLPLFNFRLSEDCSEVVFVGKWYCPFLYVKEGGVKLRDQVKNCMFYEIRLEQRWEKIFERINEDYNNDSDHSVFVDAFVERQAVFVDGKEAVWGDRYVGAAGFMWFRSLDEEGEAKSVGLSVKVEERIKWEEERVGWVDGDERQVRVERVEEYGSRGGGRRWRRFGCYVLVERFVLKRMSVTGNAAELLAYDFKHTHQIRSKWE